MWNDTSLQTTDSEEIIEIAGWVERIAFQSEQSGFAVFTLKNSTNDALHTVVGNSLEVQVGTHVCCKGKWIKHPKFGLQLQAEHIYSAPPKAEVGIEKYLASGLIKGIGPKFAKILLDAFGEQVFDVFDNHPQRLLNVPGIGPKKQEKIIESWQQHKSVRQIYIFLQENGVSTRFAAQIHKNYGARAIDRVKANPYQMTIDIIGIGFKTADQIAKGLGFAQHEPARIAAGLMHCLQQASLQGSCGLAEERLIQQAGELLELPIAEIAPVLSELIDSSRLIAVEINDQTYCALPELYQAECAIADLVKNLMAGRTNVDFKDLAKVIAKVQKEHHLELSNSQQQAVELALNNKISIITGGPGVGKTTVVNIVLNVFEQFVEEIVLCAPTGRAAKRLQETTGRSASTIHRLLEYDPFTKQFKHNEENALDLELIVVDEVSMVDVYLMQGLLAAIPEHAIVLLVGDADQLPSVGPGNVLNDLIQSEYVPTVHLTEIYRQAQDSKIVINAHKINQGEMPDLIAAKEELSDFYFIKAAEPERLTQTLIQAVAQRIPQRFSFDPLKDIQVLTPMNRGLLGTQALNEALQASLNPNRNPEIVHFNQHYRVADKVIQTSNNYDKEIFNGDIGFIKTIDKEEQEITIEFDGREVVYEKNELDQLNHAYATTIHKAQGSEYPAVVIVLTQAHYPLLERNLLYTAVTRAKKLVVLLGEPLAIKRAISQSRAFKRVSFLKNKFD